MAISLSVKKYNQEGDMAHEYRPLRNKLQQNKDQYDESGNPIQPKDLTDFRTKEINVDLNNPLTIECQPSYDGTVNLIINDDKNPPRIINSRFTTIEDNRYRIINRNQKEQTNIYEETLIDQQTRLFRNLNKIPRIQFVSEDYFGKLKGGNYTFYIKLGDNDFNKTDVVCESGQISVFNGTLSDPKTITGTLQDEETDKSVSIKINNIDTSFQKVYLYYTRETCDINGTRVTEAAMIKEPYDIKTDFLDITVNGYEEIEKINEEELNVKYLYVDKVKTQAQNQGMLFFGNVEMTTVEPRDLQNLSLYINVHLIQNRNSIGYLNLDYTTQSNDDIEQTEYYNPQNIYYNLGYWPDEIYRLGIVYIMRDDSLSEVFNLRGTKFFITKNNSGIGSNNDEGLWNILDSSSYKNWWTGAKRIVNDKEITVWNTTSDNRPITKYEYIEQDGKIVEVATSGNWEDVNLNYIPKDDFITTDNRLENIMGVFKIPNNIQIWSHNEKKTYTWGFKIDFPRGLKERLMALGVKGFFIVRQKRIPTTICQGLAIGVDRSSHVPCIPMWSVKDQRYNYETEGFLNNQRTLATTYKKLTTKYKSTSALLSIDPCVIPNLQSQFDGSEYVFQEYEPKHMNQDESNSRIYLASYGTDPLYSDYSYPSVATQKQNIVYVGEDIPAKYIAEQSFSTRAGAAEDVKQLSFFSETDYSENNYNLLRGIWCPILGIGGNLKDNWLYNIKIKNYSAVFEKDYFKIRGNDNSLFYAITDRYALNDSVFDYPENEDITGSITAFRGDCYTCTVTIRLQRNFTDTDVPNNNQIINPNTWKEYYHGYTTTEEDDWLSINRADINTVPIGSWITWKCLSSYNLGLRSLDDTNVEEMALMGNPRSFYPISGANVSVSNKLSESWKLNEGLSSTVSRKGVLPVQDVPYVRDIFDTRIMFSNVQQDDAFQNAYRIFQGLSFEDMDRQYGGLVKLITWGTSLLAIFEHGITIIPVNEKALLSTTTGQSIHMYGAGVLQKQMTVISQDYGSIWQESIIRTPLGVYGVDTYAKKIWRYSQNKGLELISDAKIQRYLNDHIKLKEKDKYPTIALRNVKSHYNNYKGDIMFTFYNDTEDEEWNICYNERLDKWSTRYSWIPLYSENVNNIYYSLDKKRAEILAYIYDNINAASGIVSVTQDSNKWLDINQNHEINLKVNNYDYYKYFHFEIKQIKSSYLDETGKEIFVDCDMQNVIEESNVTLVNNTETQKLELHFTGDVSKQGQAKFTLNKNILTKDNHILYYLYFVVEATPYNTGESTEVINDIISGDIITGSSFKTVFGIVLDRTKLSLEQQAEYDELLKNGFYVHGRAGIFDEIDYFNEERSKEDQIMPTVWYDKQEPFEFEFVVTEPTGLHKIFNNLVIISNNVTPSEIEYEIVGDVYHFNKAGIFWRYHKSLNEKRDDVEKEWEDYNNPGKFEIIPNDIGTTPNREFWVKSQPSKTSEEFKNAEVEWDPILNQYLLKVKQPCYDIKTYGRMRGNITYKEDAWYLTIDPILFRKADVENKTDYGVTGTDVDEERDDYKSTRIRDKWCRIRIKYSGKDLVLISAIKTMFMTNN